MRDWIIEFSNSEGTPYSVRHKSSVIAILYSEVFNTKLPPDCEMYISRDGSDMTLSNGRKDGVYKVSLGDEILGHSFDPQHVVHLLAEIS